MSKAFKKIMIGSAAAVAATAIAVPAYWASAAPITSVERLPEELGNPDGSQKAEATAVSADATVAAGTADIEGESRPVVWQQGQPKVIEVDGTDAHLNAVNSAGQAVGEYVDGEGRQQPFVVSDGEAQDLQSDGQPSAAANDISEDGTIVGSIAESKEVYRPVTWDAADPSGYQNLEGPQGKEIGTAVSVDESGDIGGDFAEVGPVVWRDEGAPDALMPSGGQVSLVDYNDGWVLGRMHSGEKTTYLYQAGGKPIAFDAVSEPTAVTPDGTVLGLKGDAPALATHEGEVSELALPDGADSATASALSDNGVAGGAVITGGDSTSAAAIWPR